MFLSIFGSNMDEIFRCAWPCSSSALPPAPRDRRRRSHRFRTAGGHPSEVIQLFDSAYACLRESIRPALTRAGIQLLDYADLDEEARGALNEYFQRTVFPVLTPLAFDPGRPFPHISNLSLNLAVVVTRRAWRGALCAGQNSQHPAAAGAVLRCITPAPDNQSGTPSSGWSS